MSDFSELCPLFNTGVFSEILFPTLEMTAISNTAANALDNSIVGNSTGQFLFSRTVVVTAAWVRIAVQMSATSMSIVLNHMDSAAAAVTAIGSVQMSMAVADQIVKETWVPMTVTDTTFTSAAVLGLAVGTSTTSGGGTYDLMVRYKEA